MRKILMQSLMMGLVSLTITAEPEMVLIPADTGNSKLKIEKDFYIGKYEVQQAEFEEKMKFNPSNLKGDKNPVETVTWFDAVVYCNKLSEEEKLTPYYNISDEMKDEDGNIRMAKVSIPGGKGYRLPTQKEWEYAARGGSKSKGYIYSGSNTIGAVAWNYSNSNDTTHPVGEKQANEIGLYDMTGNVMEWCNDEYYDMGRAIRGGGYSTGDEMSEIRYRNGGNSFSKDKFLGFRIARDK